VDDPRRPRLTAGVDFRALDDLSCVVVAPNSGRVHALDAVAAAILERSNGSATVADIAGEPVDIFDAPANQIARDVDAFLADLATFGIVEW
jgi:hypothetical protein